MNKFVELLPAQAAHYGDREELRYRDYRSQEWTSMSWNALRVAADQAACSFAELGVEVQGRVCVFSQNCPEIFVTHFGAFGNRAIPVPIYATSSKDEAAYIINDAGATILMVGDQRQYEIARDLLAECATLRYVVVFDPTVTIEPNGRVFTWEQFLELGSRTLLRNQATVDQRRRESVDTDLMYLIYTSGTTGQPKGVMLTHSNFVAAMDNHGRRIAVDDENDISLSFLPFSHIFELGWSMFCLTRGVRVAINLNPKEIQRAVKEVSPTCMCSVPRFWEKVYAAVKDNLAAAKPVVRLLVKRAISVGRTRNLKYRRAGKKVPFLIEKQYEYFENKVFRKLRAAIGIEKGRFFPTAGAMLSDNITEFLHAVGVNIVIGYGLSETNASVSFFDTVDWELGSVGTPIPDVQVRIGDRNEILVKGPTVMKGYYHRPEETAEVLDADGWFHTGDCGEITPHGSLILTERIKDLYKTSNGKYIAPQMLETLLGQDKYIEQVAIIGDGRNYVSALIVPDFNELRAYADKRHISYDGLDELVNDPEVRRMIEDRINDYQKNLASYEQVKRFVLLPRPFTMETGELTNTLKIRRAVINKRYAKLIDAMYAADYRKKKDNQ